MRHLLCLKDISNIPLAMLSSHKWDSDLNEISSNPGVGSCRPKNLPHYLEFFGGSEERASCTVGLMVIFAVVMTGNGMHSPPPHAF
jgi:hypothetical protein